MHVARPSLPRRFLPFLKKIPQIKKYELKGLPFSKISQVKYPSYRFCKLRDLRKFCKLKNPS